MSADPLGIQSEFYLRLSSHTQYCQQRFAVDQMAFERHLNAFNFANNIIKWTKGSYVGRVITSVLTFQ